MELGGAEGDFLAGAEGAFRFLLGGFRGNKAVLEVMREFVVGEATPGDTRRGKGKFIFLGCK